MQSAEQIGNWNLDKSSTATLWRELLSDSFRGSLQAEPIQRWTIKGCKTFWSRTQEVQWEVK